MLGRRLTFLVLLSLGSTQDCGPQTNIYDHVLADCRRHPTKTSPKSGKEDQTNSLFRSKSMSRAEARKARRHTMATPAALGSDPNSYPIFLTATNEDARDLPSEKKLSRRFSMPVFASKKAKRASDSWVDAPIVEPKKAKRASSVHWADSSEVEPKRAKRASLVAEKSAVERPKAKRFSSMPCSRRLEVLREGEEWGCSPRAVERTSSVTVGRPECRKRAYFRASKRLSGLMRRRTWMPEAKRGREPEFNMVVDSDTDSEVGVVTCE